jgi:hypothetical protein
MDFDGSLRIFMDFHCFPLFFLWMSEGVCGPGGSEATRLAGQGLQAKAWRLGFDWGDCWLVGVGAGLCSHTLDAQRGRRIYVNLRSFTLNYDFNIF